MLLNMEFEHKALDSGWTLNQDGEPQFWIHRLSLDRNEWVHLHFMAHFVGLDITNRLQKVREIPDKTEQVDRLHLSSNFDSCGVF